jgi:hypothetical protein
MEPIAALRSRRVHARMPAGSGAAMGFLYFVFGVVVGTLLLVLLPLFIAVLGAALAIGIVIALPLIVALLILVGIVAMAPAVGYGLLIAALLIALWSSDRKRRQPRWPSRHNL